MLRSDGDLYSSTIQTLENLYGNVVDGGYVVFNNWRNAQVANAAIDFRKANDITAPVLFYDNSSTSIPNYGIAYWQK